MIQNATRERSGQQTRDCAARAGGETDGCKAGKTDKKSGRGHPVDGRHGAGQADDGLLLPNVDGRLRVLVKK